MVNISESAGLRVDSFDAAVFDTDTLRTLGVPVIEL